MERKITEQDIKRMGLDELEENIIRRGAEEQETINATELSWFDLLFSPFSWRNNAEQERQASIKAIMYYVRQYRVKRNDNLNMYMNFENVCKYVAEFFYVQPSWIACILKSIPKGSISGIDCDGGGHNRIYVDEN